MDEEISLIELFEILWKRKIFIISGVGVFFVITVMFFILYPLQYQSSGFLSLSSNSYRMLLPDYKKASLMFFNKKLFELYSLNKMKNEEKWKSFLNGLLLSKHVKPVYAYTEEDRKKMGGFKEIENYVVGVKITVKNKSETLAKTSVSLMGEFIRDSIFYQKLREFIIAKFGSAKVYIENLNKRELSSLFTMRLLNEKRAMLNAILRKYKSSQKVYEKQIIPMDKGSYQYLSPVIQLIGVETQISELKVSLLRIEREKKKTELIIAFLEKIIPRMKEIKSGSNLLELWNKKFETFFSEKKGENDFVREVKCSLDASVLGIEDRFYRKIGFSSDTIKVSKIRYPVKKITFLVLFFSFLLFSFIALLIEGSKEEK